MYFYFNLFIFRPGNTYFTTEMIKIRKKYLSATETCNIPRCQQYKFTYISQNNLQCTKGAKGEPPYGQRLLYYYYYY